MAETALDDGIETIVATPHQLGNYANNSGRIIRAAAENLQRELDRRRLPLRVLPGAEVRIEPGLVEKIRRGEVLTLGDNRRHVMLELPHGVYFPIERLLGDLAHRGLVGILAHPERNRGIINRPGVLRPLVERGCLLQVTAGSLTGDFGAEIKKLSESLVARGLVHFVGTDSHGVGNRPPLLGEAFGRVRQLIGEEGAADLCRRNPRLAAVGGTVSPGCRDPAKPALLGWFRRTFSLEQPATKPI